jgi:hypothetical protein
MKRKIGLCTLAMIAVFSVAARAQSVSPVEKDKAMQYLQSTEKNVEDAVKGLSVAQWNYKPAPDRWSIAECVEHIAAAEDKLRGYVVDMVMKGPAAPGRDVKAIDEKIMMAIPDRSKKAQAPDELRPTNRYGSPENALKHFAETRAMTEDFLKNTPDLREHAVDSPFGDKYDGYDWVLFIAAHSDRHTKQILEVKADPNFPKN